MSGEILARLRYVTWTEKQNEAQKSLYLDFQFFDSEGTSLPVQVSDGECFLSLDN